MTEEKQQLLPQNCILEERKKLSVTGVTEVGSFDEECVTAATELGELTVKGENLHITSLSLEIGEMVIEGKIFVLSYTDAAPKNEGFFAKVFR